MKPVWVDWLIAASFVVVVSAVLSFSGIFQWWHDWGGSHGLLISNGVPSLLVGLVVGLGWLSYRRGRMVRETATIQVRAEREATQRHRQFMDAVESLPIGIAFFDKEDRLAFCNGHYVRMNPIDGSILMGRTFEENLRHWVELGLYPEAEGREEAWIRERLQRHRQTDGSFEYEREMAGRHLWIHEHRTPDGGNLIVVDDITERVRMEEAFRQSEARLRAILDHSPASIYLKDCDDRFLVVNREFERRNSVSTKEILGRRPLEVLEKEIVDLVEPEEKLVMENRAAMSFERTLEYRNGNKGTYLAVRFPVMDDAGELIGVGSISADVTEHRETEKRARELQLELAHVARMRTMGELAAGFAHELNQPLAAINNYVAGVLRRLRAREEGHSEFVPILESISEQARRGGEIIRNIRGFIRKDQEVNKALIDINEAVSVGVDMLAGELALNRIALARRMSPEVPRVFANAVEIQQVVLNLLRNAIDAVLVGDPPRRIEIRTEPYPDGASGVRIAVEDTGPGIPSDVRQRLFEPFFTTKEDGMGMGLLICRTIIEDHGGELRVDPMPGRGTVVSFRLAAEGRTDSPGEAAEEGGQALPLGAGRAAYRDGPEAE